MALPIAAAIIGSALIGAYQAQEQASAARQAQSAARREGVQNQNKAIEEGFNARRSNFGLGDDMTSPLGNQASQSGTILTSTTSNGRSGLGL